MLQGLRSPTPHGARYFGAKIYPTGEGVMFPRRSAREGGGSILEDIRQDLKKAREFYEENCRLFGLQATCSLLLAIAGLNSNLQASRMLGEGEPLDSSSTAISHSPRNRRGAKGLSTHSKRVLRFSAATVEKRAGSPSVLSFLTLTLPPMSEASWVAVLGGWGDIVRTFNQWLSRRLKSKGLPGHLVGCTELQPCRSTRTGEPALHLHIVFQGRKHRSSWAVAPLECRKAWKRAVMGKISECLEFSATENLVRVRKSAAKYLAKYFSKGSLEWATNVAPPYKNLHPNSWSFTPDELKRLYHASTWQGDEAIAVLQLAINFPQYRYGEIVSLPIYQLPNGQWVKVALVKLDRAFARSLDCRWTP